jgi:hypothetical protein
MADPVAFFFPPPLLAKAMTTRPSIVALTSDFLSMWFSLSVKILFIFNVKVQNFF